MKQKKWNMDNITDQKSKTVIVTGASSGIGYEAARVLANKNAKVIIAVRNMEKGNKAAEKIRNEYENASLNVMELDLADLSSVSKFADNYKKEYSKLDVLINNAGVMMPPYSKTGNGFELQMGTNHFGHFSLTLQLLDILANTEWSRIVNVSSMAHRWGNINFDDINWENRKYRPSRSYGDSKIANLYFTYELAQKLNSKYKKIIVAAAHPGWAETELQRHSGVTDFLNRFFAQNAVMGALPTLIAAVGPSVKTGDFYGPSGFMQRKGYPKKVKSSQLSLNRKIAEKLWQVSVERTGVKSEIS
ncbi:MAG: oxidoreductase [Acidobacteriota bacterium]